MGDEVQQVTGSPIAVVPTDSVTVVVSDVVSETTDRQTQELTQVVQDGDAALQTRIETLTYEQQQVIEGIADDAAVKTADELERREAAKAEAEAEGGQTREAYTTVRLDATQWDYVRQSMQWQNTCAAFSLMVLVAILGAMVTGYLLDRWRS